VVLYREFCLLVGRVLLISQAVLLGESELADLGFRVRWRCFVLSPLSPSFSVSGKGPRSFFFSPVPLSFPLSCARPRAHLAVRGVVELNLSDSPELRNFAPFPCHKPKI